MDGESEHEDVDSKSHTVVTSSDWTNSNDILLQYLYALVIRKSWGKSSVSSVPVSRPGQKSQRATVSRNPAFWHVRLDMIITRGHDSCSQLAWICFDSLQITWFISSLSSLYYVWLVSPSWSWCKTPMTESSWFHFQFLILAPFCWIRLQNHHGRHQNHSASFPWSSGAVRSELIVVVNQPTAAAASSCRSWRRRWSCTSFLIHFLCCGVWDDVNPLECANLFSDCIPMTAEKGTSQAVIISQEQIHSKWADWF